MGFEIETIYEPAGSDRGGGRVKSIHPKHRPGRSGLKLKKKMIKTQYGIKNSLDSD
jgi:hypothetical protein